VLDCVRGCARVLDVGCGSSRMILDLPHAIGLDIRQNKLRWLSWRRSRLVRGSCERLPFRDGTSTASARSSSRPASASAAPSRPRHQQHGGRS
jgi:ubiquinone/menaquinone biosynthesis C-methylase UbiE